MIIPKVKTEELTQNDVIVPKKLTVAHDKYGIEVCKMLKYFLPQCEAQCADNARIKTVKIEDALTKYTLTITREGLIIAGYSNYEALRNAIATLANLAKSDGDKLVFPAGKIEDYPVIDHRGIMIDLARGIKDFESLKRDIILIAKLKMNVLHLHLSDGEGSCFEMESLPEDYWLKGAYTKNQMVKLCELAKLLALEIIPEFDMPAHSGQMIKVFPQLGCEVESGKDLSPWTVCPGTPEVYNVYEKVINEIVSLFPGKYFHMGGDELDFADQPQLNALCYWNDCIKCRALRKKENIKDRQQEYYYFVRKIYDIVKKTGRIMIMWSDQLDCNRKKELPDDIIMHFWRVAELMRGPVEGCSMNAQLKMGYKVINSYYPETYIDIEEYMSSDSLSTWRWNKSPQCDDELAGQIIGSELCAWDYGKKDIHYDKTLPSAVAIMSDKLWSGQIIEYTYEYKEAVTKSVLGASTPQNLDVFKCIGDILPPRTQSMAYYDKVEADKYELQKTIGLLKMSELYLDGDSERAKVYLQCISDVYNYTE